MIGALALTLLAAAPAVPSAASSPFPWLPADHRQLVKTITYDRMTALLRFAGEHPHVTVSEEARTAKGRSVFLVHLDRSGGKARWRVLFYAQQHGNEVAGKDALLYMITAVAARPEILPEDVDLWIMPMMNPDGAEADQRRNADGVDLNRDHLTLKEPETQALHRVCQRVLPDVAVDCHEFTRDDEEVRARGWNDWPIIMMDGVNTPLYDPALAEAAQRWVESAAPVMERAGHAYVRYNVGGPPPEEEQRYSAFDADDARNGLGAYGVISFIIESGVKRAAPDPSADLGARVDAYLTLLWRFVVDASHRDADLATVERARAFKLAPFIPVNFFWANLGPRLTEAPVLDLATGQRKLVATPNFMHDAVVKKSVPTPLAYAVEPRAAALFGPMLERHGVTFEVLGAARPAVAERCRLLRVEDDFDELYGRYGGRQIVARDAAAPRELAAGTLLVSLDQAAAIRAALVLEPTMLYGMFAYPEYRALVGADQTIPVWRVVALPAQRPRP